MQEKARREDIREGRAQLEIQETKAVESLQARLTFINASELRIDADRFILELPGASSSIVAAPADTSRCRLSESFCLSVRVVCICVDHLPALWRSGC